MIVAAFIIAIVAVLSWLFGNFPHFSPPDTTNAVAAITDSRIWHYIAWANFFTPVDVAMQLLAARVAIAVALYGFEFLSWAGTKLHIFGGSR